MLLRSKNFCITTWIFRAVSMIFFPLIMGNCTISFALWLKVPLYPTFQPHQNTLLPKGITFILSCFCTQSPIEKFVVVYHKSCLRTLLLPHELVAHQIPLSMEFSRQVSWSGLPSPPPGDWTCVSHISYIGRQVLYH